MHQVNINMFPIVYLFLEKYVYWCEDYSNPDSISGTLMRANYSSEGCPATFNAQVVYTFGSKKMCHNIALGAKMLYFIEDDHNK